MNSVTETLDHLFRREHGKIVAYLTHFLGLEQLDLAESVVQEALLKATQNWPLKGLPDNPSAWITRVAKNAAIDHIRKNKYNLQDSLESLEDLSDETETQEYSFENEVRDDQLKLIFVCCHPEINKDARIALTLKTVCGFSIQEIARAFLAKDETIAQRIVRAKRRISEQKLNFSLPHTDEIELRLHSVLEVLYFVFNEGYLATEGHSLIRKELCGESIHLLTELTRQPICQKPQVFALLALMHLQASRFNSRLNLQGDLLLLEEQDRSLWDQNHIALGLKFLERSAEGEELSDYHLEAGIASCHVIAPSFEATDWKQILSYYDVLLIKKKSPIIALNRAVAIAMAEGFNAGLRELEQICNHPSLQSYHLLPATFAEIYRRMGNFTEAKKFYQEALKLVKTEPEKRLLEKRINACKNCKNLKR